MRNTPTSEAPRPKITTETATQNHKASWYHVWTSKEVRKLIAILLECSPRGARKSSHQKPRAMIVAAETSMHFGLKASIGAVKRSFHVHWRGSGCQAGGASLGVVSTGAVGWGAAGSVMAGTLVSLARLAKPSGQGSQR